MELFFFHKFSGGASFYQYKTPNRSKSGVSYLTIAAVRSEKGNNYLLILSVFVLITAALTM
jgi:hypothetical protein